jgi:hypothetical protein
MAVLIDLGPLLTTSNGLVFEFQKSNLMCKDFYILRKAFSAKYE